MGSNPSPRTRIFLRRPPGALRRARRIPYRAEDRPPVNCCPFVRLGTRSSEHPYTMIVMMTIVPTSDAITSIPLHRSTLRVLQQVKSAAETWDEFLINVTDDYLSPSLRAELDRRLVTDRVVTGAEARREFEERRRRAR